MARIPNAHKYGKSPSLPAGGRVRRGGREPEPSSEGGALGFLLLLGLGALLVSVVYKPALLAIPVLILLALLNR